MQLQENMVVADRFRLGKMIGRGGMGSVWQAMHLGLDTPCAVKFIEGELANVAEAHARFEREAKAAAQLRSPNVVQIFDHGVWQGHPYIAMELLDGEDLGKRLARNGGKLHPAVVNTVVQQVCRALSKAHAAGVVHRDLKPDNIFLVTDDDREIVKILDFGVAKSTSNAIDGSNTKTGAMLGTPYYMSPEQAQGIKSVDARSDLWSLAVIVFQCLTGRLPFESEALGDLLVKIIVNPIPVPSQYNREVPVGFDRWWAKAADRNVDGRFQTAKEFAQELAVALGQSSPDANTDRAVLQRMGGGTAMMNNAPGTEILSNVPNTPMPGQQTAALPTPNPAFQSRPPGGVPNTPMPHVPPQPPMGQAGQPGSPHHMSTGNPVVAATFSGMDASTDVPKKSPPVALFAAVGVLALIGLGLGGFAMVKRSQGAGSGTSATASETASSPIAKNGPGDTSADPTGSAAPTGAGAGTAATATEGTAATETAGTATAPTASTAPSATATATAATTATSKGTGAIAAGGTPKGTAGGTKPVTTGQATAATAATTAATAAKPPATGGQKPINLGF